MTIVVTNAGAMACVDRPAQLKKKFLSSRSPEQECNDAEYLQEFD